MYASGMGGPFQRTRQAWGGFAHYMRGAVGRVGSLELKAVALLAILRGKVLLSDAYLCVHKRRIRWLYVLACAGNGSVHISHRKTVWSQENVLENIRLG